jgi:acetolactate synthase-1/2/3 large subunit
MAEAHGKATGRPGICFVTCGPGATNAAAAVHIARQDSTPLILFVGQISRKCASARPSRSRLSRGVRIDRQMGDRDRRSRPNSRARLRAFYTATSGRPEPVVMALPEDMLVERIAVADAPAFEPVGRPAPPT